MSYSIEAELVSWLGAELGVPCHGEVPRPIPDELCTVERTGGGCSPGIDRPEVTVQLWATTRARAMELALAARDALALRGATVPGVRSCTVNAGPYSFPDPDTRRPRYQIFVALVTRQA